MSPNTQESFKPMSVCSQWWRSMVDGAIEENAISCRLGGVAVSALREVALADFADLERGLQVSFSSNTSQEIASVFEQFPVLRRLAEGVLADWVDFINEFINRLAADRAALDEFFGGGDPLGEMTGLDASLSDRHDAGRRVLRMTFGASGRQIYYKPKNFSAELGLACLISRLQNDGLSDLPDLPRTLARMDLGEYGWVESVCPSACCNEEEVRSYYRKAGMLLGLGYFFHGTDCTMDNLIATNSGPILIDTETFFQPAVRPFGPKEMPRSKVPPDFSVLETQLLPFTHFALNGVRCDISGLGGAPNERAGEGTQPNQPVLNGERQPPERYVEEIVAGFRTLAGVIVQNRDALLEMINSSAFKKGLMTRLIFRGSAAYDQFLERLRQPIYYSSEERWIEAFEDLSRSFVDRSVPIERFWPLVSAECAALDRLDIPRFYVSAEDEDLKVGDERICGFFHESAVERVCGTIAEFDDTSLEFQVGLIRVALRPPSLGLGLWSHRAASAPPWLEIALEIADAIHGEAKFSESASAWWPRPLFERPEPAPTYIQRADLYEGALGTALFLAAAQRAVGVERYREAILGSALAASEALTYIVAEDTKAAIGAGGGLGSFVLGGLFISRLTGYPEFAQLAALAVEEITLERIAASDSVDVFQGLAGGALALLAYHQETGDKAALEKAVHCGRHLVERCTGSGVWDEDGESGLLGFAHGTAGIGLALRRLHATTRLPAFLKAFLLATKFQNAAIHSALPHGPIRHSHSCTDVNGWCHGGPGIALARLGMLDMTDAVANRADISEMLCTSAGRSVQYDHLCCGRGGHIEVLLTAAQALHDPSLAELAEKHARSLLARAVTNGHYTLLPYFARNLCILPGLFRGVGGLGYIFLRLAGQKMPFSLASFCLE